MVPALVTTFRAYAYQKVSNKEWLKKKMLEDQDNIQYAWGLLTEKYQEGDALGALKEIARDVATYRSGIIEVLHKDYPLSNLDYLRKLAAEKDEYGIVLQCAKQKTRLAIEKLFDNVFSELKSVNVMVDEAYENIFRGNRFAAAAEDVKKFLLICFRDWMVEYEKCSEDKLARQKTVLSGLSREQIYEAWTEISRLYELQKNKVPLSQAVRRQGQASQEVGEPNTASKKSRKGIDILREVFKSFYVYLQSKHSWTQSTKVQNLMIQTGYTTNNIDSITQKLMEQYFQTDNFEALWDLFLKVMGFLRLLAPSKLSATLVFGSPSKEWPHSAVNAMNYGYVYKYEDIPARTKGGRSKKPSSLPALGGSLPAQGGFGSASAAAAGDVTESDEELHAEG